MTLGVQVDPGELEANELAIKNALESAITAVDKATGFELYVPPAGGTRSSQVNLTEPPLGAFPEASNAIEWYQNLNAGMQVRMVELRTALETMLWNLAGPNGISANYRYTEEELQKWFADLQRGMDEA